MVYRDVLMIGVNYKVLSWVIQRQQQPKKKNKNKKNKSKF
jgi:hypothetical protein